MTDHIMRFVSTLLFVAAVLLAGCGFGWWWSSLGLGSGAALKSAAFCVIVALPIEFVLRWGGFGQFKTSKSEQGK